MTFLGFEARRLGRNIGFGSVFGVILAGGAAAAILDPSQPPFALYLLPLVATWVGAFDLAAGIAGGRFDLLVSRGVTLRAVLVTRFLLAVLVSGAAFIALAAPSVVSGEARWHALGELAGTLVYWAAVGAALGLALSATGAVLLALVGTALANWWLLVGCGRLTHQPPTVPPSSFVSFVGQVILNVIPAGEIPLLRGASAGWELARWPLAVLVLAMGCRWARRRNLHAREEA